jgi:ATP-dependent Lon protease
MLGEVMKESARIAFSLVRSRAARLKLSPEVFDKSQVHIHVPAGAVPKDGPSAGVTMTSALASLFTGRRVRGDLAMTGEVTLSGQVLPIGGVKEKVLGALRAGLTHIVLAEANRDSLDELSEEVKNKLTFHFVSNFDELLRQVLEPVAPGKARGAK